MVDALDLAIGAIETTPDVGWTRVDELDNGYLYEVRSPQDHVCLVKIYTETVIGFPDRDFVMVQFIDEDEELFGTIHRLECLPGREYRVIVHGCGIWIWEPTVSRGGDNSVCGGLLYVPEGSGDCASNVDDAITEAWWSAGAPQLPNQGESFYHHFRNSYRVYGLLGTEQLWSGCYNGVLARSNDSGAKHMTIYPLASPGAYSTAPAVRFFDDRPLHHEALIGWNSNGQEVTFRGQIYDAFCISESSGVDHEETFSQFGRAINFMGDSDTRERTRHLSLYLLDGWEGQEGELSNYAY